MINSNSITNSLWVEKYRPKNLKDMVISDETREIIENYISQGIIPNIFLCSRPGQGKTSLAKVLVDIFDVDSLYINCSDDNNVDTVRNKITNFAKTLSTNGKFKIIILDECDGFANVQSQKILRSLMEEVSENTRFILTANFKNKIIEAIQSRCQFIDLNPKKADVARRVVEILKKERIPIVKEQFPLLSDLINRFFPDIRSIIKEIQNCVIKNEDNTSTLKLRAIISSDKVLKKILSSINNNKMIELRTYLIQNESDFNSDYVNLLYDFYKMIIVNEDLEDNTRIHFTITLADYLYKSSFIIDTEINTMACFFTLSEIQKKIIT